MRAAVITRYYDSLLEKVTALGPDARKRRLPGWTAHCANSASAASHQHRLCRKPAETSDISERYLYHQIHRHDAGPVPFKKRRDRATKILTYIADITVNGHPETAGRPKPPAEARAPKPPAEAARRPCAMGTRNLLEQKGPQAVADWMLAQSRLLITDTTMRDGHQSLLATRMRSIDMIRVAPAYAANLPQLFSVECWGGLPSMWPTASCRNAPGSACATCARPCPT
jgi:pyruvate carboxylase